MVTYSLDRFHNGVQVAVAQCPYWQSAAIGVFSAFGSRHEPEARNGIAHFTEHMLFKGTKRRNARRISVDAESVGGSLNAYTSEEHTCYHAKSPANHLKRMADLLSDIYQHSQFPEVEIERERGVIEEEILMYREQPGSHVEELLSEVAWPNHSLGRPILGTPRSLAKIGREEFHRYVARAHGAANTTLAIATPAHREEVLNLLEPLFGSLPKATRAKTGPFIARPRPDHDRILIEEREIEQVHLTLGFQTEGRSSNELFTGRLLSVLLGETMSSRLNQELREKRGLAYQVYSQSETFADVGLVSIYAGVDDDSVIRALRVIVRELKRLQDKAPSRTELKQALEYTRGHQLMGLEDSGSQMFWIGDAVTHGERDYHPLTFLEKLSRVTSSDIQSLAQKIFRWHNLSAAILGPRLESQRDAIENLLKTLD